MKNQDNTYQQLLEHASTALGISEQELKHSYKDYPVCLMEYIESGVEEHVLEVRFDKLSSTLSLSFNKNNLCDSVFLFFDTEEAEDLFINYMVETSGFNFRKRYWKLKNCYLEIRNVEKETAFYFHK